MVDAVLVCGQNLDMNQVTSSVSNSCHQEQTFRKMP